MRLLMLSPVPWDKLAICPTTLAELLENVVTSEGLAEEGCHVISSSVGQIACPEQSRRGNFSLLSRSPRDAKIVHVAASVGDLMNFAGDQ